jgi:hypothetical protein
MTQESAADSLNSVYEEEDLRRRKADVVLRSRVEETSSIFDDELRQTKQQSPLSEQYFLPSISWLECFITRIVEANSGLFP